ncbi:AAA family ATPase [Rhizobium laguerreae]|uniref:AAA family ATPase n=1 Tax=Rhizobium laguerreae TaxID=1076926 RepID=UPI001478FEC8|nr:AAA family ATPase [Rhizobium laguerreae]NNH84985.1 AAA family ATPase [Rhizobium laguerreae]
MQIKKIELENYGSIKFLAHKFAFQEDGRPKPTIFVGQNGAGKSLILSHILNAILVAKSVAFTDSEIDVGKAYKFRSPAYVKHGEDFYRSHVEFENDFWQLEYQLSLPRQMFEEAYGYSSVDPKWNSIPLDQASHLGNNFNPRLQELRQTMDERVLLYFPPNRFEEPAWLNKDNLINGAKYGSYRPVQGISNRTIIGYSPLRDNQNWLLDVIYDCFALERKVQTVEATVGGNKVPLLALMKPEGPGTNIRLAVEQFFKTLLQREGSVRWIVGNRGRRSISFEVDTKPCVTNIFALSTGQTALLNIFLTIIRDCDLSASPFVSLEEIRGIVVVDEVDLHLHSDLQHNILPSLIALFPKVQFVMTTHSPLFILGLERTLGSDGFDLIELPSGVRISPERFSEFEKAYNFFRDSAKFEGDIRAAVTDSQRPVIFVEGSIDIDYIIRAAELLGRQESIGNARLLDANGYTGLDKIWKLFETPAATLNQQITLLYDCDVISKTSAQKDGIRRIVLPKLTHRISKGIENLLPDDLLERARAANPALIDYSPATISIVRGKEIEVPESWSVNPNEKRNLADWVIANATADELASFGLLFDLLGA